MKYIYILSLVLMALERPTALGFGITKSSYCQNNIGRRHQKARPFIPLQMAVDVDEIEAQAVATSEAWGIEITDFLESNDAAKVEEKLGGRADVACLRVGGRPNSVRARFVLTNPDLEMDIASAEAEYCRVLCVANVDLGRADPWPNVLTSIGVDLEKVGDIIEDGSTAFLVVDPGIVKTCSRLLPKELPGSGIAIEELVPGTDEIPDGGTLQDMEIQRLDKREQKRK